MNTWKWKLLCFGYSHNNDKYIIHMGFLFYVKWIKIIGNLYFSTKKVNHIGLFWEHPSLKWYKEYLKSKKI